MKVLTIIPAKLGSTRLKRKNVLPLGGKPLLAWTIDAALESNVCGTVMVSTESLEIAEAARAAGAEVPFLRPEHLSRDPYGVANVCEHVLEEYGARGEDFDAMVVLLPTSPFRTAEDVREGMKLFIDTKAPFVSSVSPFGCDIFSAHQFGDGGGLEPLFPEYFKQRPHLRPVPYEINGAVMIAHVKRFLVEKTLCGEGMIGFAMPWQRCVDIDTEADFAYASYLLEKGIIYV